MIPAKKTNDITTKYSVSSNVQETFKTACFDCHSNSSEYPWYWKIQPLAWFMNQHIREGKQHLNFSEFTRYPIWRQYKMLDEINEEVKSGGMPITSYKFIHADARLCSQQKAEISTWVNSTMNYMQDHNPPDSLKRPDTKRVKRKE